MLEIKLFNRDGAKLKLSEVEENTWKFTVDKEHKYVLENIRVISDKEGEIIAVDPSGGPYLSRGQRISSEYVINNIINDNEILIKTRKERL
jgi:hypothetical protein